MEDDPIHGIFRHKCEEPGCDNHIIYDDEPRCFKHSPDSGSSVRGYSAYAKHLRQQARERSDRAASGFATLTGQLIGEVVNTVVDKNHNQPF